MHFVLFFRYSERIQLPLFQGLGGLNEAKGKDWAKKGDAVRMGDKCVEVCDDSVRNDKETERETAGFTAPRPTCLDLWTGACVRCMCVRTKTTNVLTPLQTL